MIDIEKHQDEILIYDAVLIHRILNGSRTDLEVLLKRYQGWIYNVALKMTLSVRDAEDTTQEILIKLFTKLSTYDAAKASFRTWLYRIVANHVMNMKKSRYEKLFSPLDGCEPEMENIPDESIDGSPEALILTAELQIKCLTGMLLCLDRRHRFIFIMSEIFDVCNGEGADILSTSRDNYRQLRSRSRRKVYNFINRTCGLVDPDNPCHCRKKLKGLIRMGFINPDNLLFYKEKMTSVETVLRRNRTNLAKAYCSSDARQLFKTHPFYDPPDFQHRLSTYFNIDIVRLLNG